MLLVNEVPGLWITVYLVAVSDPEWSLVVWVAGESPHEADPDCPDQVAEATSFTTTTGGGGKPVPASSQVKVASIVPSDEQVPHASASGWPLPPKLPPASSASGSRKVWSAELAARRGIVAKFADLPLQAGHLVLGFALNPGNFAVCGIPHQGEGPPWLGFAQAIC